MIVALIAAVGAEAADFDSSITIDSVEQSPGSTVIGGSILSDEKCLAGRSVSIDDAAEGEFTIATGTTAADGTFELESTENPAVLFTAIGAASGTTEGPDTPAAIAALEAAESAASDAATDLGAAAGALAVAERKLAKAKARKKRAEKKGKRKKLRKAKKKLKRAKKRVRSAKSAKAAAAAAKTAADAGVVAADAAVEASMVDYTCNAASDTMRLPLVSLTDYTPEPTNLSPYPLTGSTDPSAELEARNGDSVAIDSADPAGDFSIPLTLELNALNEIFVTASVGPIEGQPASLSIVHDNIAPAVPTAITASSAPCPGGVTTGGAVAGGAGAVEAAASVLVENLTRGTTSGASAAGNGSFSAPLGLCAGDVVRITATDSAGNSSTPLETSAS